MTKAEEKRLARLAEQNKGDEGSEETIVDDKVTCEEWEVRFHDYNEKTGKWETIEKLKKLRGGVRIRPDQVETLNNGASKSNPFMYYIVD